MAAAALAACGAPSPPPAPPPRERFAVVHSQHLIDGLGIGRNIAVIQDGRSGACFVQVTDGGGQSTVLEVRRAVCEA